jgi:hypothetical protein
MKGFTCVSYGYEIRSLTSKEEYRLNVNWVRREGGGARTWEEGSDKRLKICIMRSAAICTLSPNILR